jgi:hypothetical protein
MNTTRRVGQILTDTPSAAALMARVAAARQTALLIAPVCATVAPEFDPLQPGACELRAGVLRIRLRSNAHSTKLRQAIPRLLAALQGSGLEVSEIKIGVQPTSVPGKDSAKAAVKRGAVPSRSGVVGQTAKSLGQLQAFSRKLALTLPNSELRRAVVRLGAVAEVRLARMRESNQTFDEQDGEKSDTGGQPAQKDPPGPAQEARLARCEVQHDASEDRRAEEP